MPSDQVKRRLAAILAADVVGYSRLMGEDESGTFAALSVLREATEKQIRVYGGRIANTAGDSMLAEFGSVVEAVSCAVALQDSLFKESTGRDLHVRIGIHLGDVLDKAGDLFGTAVNVAARLEGIAEPGGIVVSAAVRDAIAGKLAASFTDLGLKSLKNIDEPFRAYALSPRVGFLSPGAARTGEALPLPNKPSIAVLPFDNLSGDREQEYFADGIVEEIITALSRFRGLFVIARNSSFAYKGRAVDVKQIGRELGVRYILEGSVRKSGGRVRITGQLIDTSIGAHLWADRFEGELENIFDLQDQVTTSVIGAIYPKLEEAEIERAKRKPTESLDAYDFFLRGMAAFHQFNKASNTEALAFFLRAIALDPIFAPAYGMAARCYLQRIGFGWVADRNREAAEAEKLARRAADLGKDDAVALSAAGFALVIVVGELEYGDTLIDRALALNPNLAWAWHFSSLAKALLGQTEIAIERASRAMRLSPQDPQQFGMKIAMAWAHFFACRYEEALSWAQAAVREQSNFFMAICVAAASAALAGKTEEAAKAMARLRELNPTLRVSNLQSFVPIYHVPDFQRWAEGLEKAGLPR
jgi:TolB-like protein/class 3 adenylate cyclase